MNMDRKVRRYHKRGFSCWDHIYGLDDVAADFPSAPAYIHQRDREFLTAPWLNGSALNGFQLVMQMQAKAIAEGTHRFGRYSVEVISSPGHTAGSCMFHFTEEDLLFTGDTVLAGMASTTNMPTGSSADMQASLQAFFGAAYPRDTPT